MAIVTPSTDLILLKCPLEVDQQNQLTFTSFEAQEQYFRSLPHIEVTDFTYQRKDGTVRFPAVFEDIRNYNYVMYKNVAYGNKWFYCFITDTSYVNDNVSQIQLKTDVWQTWQLTISLKSSFVEREHVNDDTIGKHTIEENLPYGEPIVNTFQEYIIASNNEDLQRIVMQVTQLPDGVTVPTGYTRRIYNGIAQGCYFCVFTGPDDMDKFTRWYDKKGQRDALVAAFLVPSALVVNAYYKNFTIGDGIGSVRVGFLPASYTAYNYDSAFLPLQSSTTLDGYTPKNKKMYCFPYSYLYVSNNAGSDVVYHYEDFENPQSPEFSIRGVIGQGCSIQCYPNNYKRVGLRQAYGSYGINCAKLPLLSWTSDYYLNWQAQNGVNNAVQGGLGILRGTAQIASGAIALGSGDSGGGMQTISGTANLISSVAETMQAQHVADLVPLQAKGNVGCADLTYTMQKCGFIFRHMSCRKDYAIMIDNFFSMFGYKVNAMKVPNVTGRRYWNYVKCIQANITGDIPQDDMNEIKSIFNAGCTFWHDPSKYLDYSQNNAIV